MTSIRETAKHFDIDADQLAWLLAAHSRGPVIGAPSGDFAAPQALEKQLTATGEMCGSAATCLPVECWRRGTSPESSHRERRPIQTYTDNKAANSDFPIPTWTQVDIARPTCKPSAATASGMRTAPRTVHSPSTARSALDLTAPDTHLYGCSSGPPGRAKSRQLQPPWSGPDGQLIEGSRPPLQLTA